MFTRFLCRIFYYPATGSILLFIATLFAMAMTNSKASFLYDYIIHFPACLDGEFFLHLNLQSIVNNGLMTIFFLFIGLEIKSEFLYGELDSFSKASFPVIAALGGMIVPALIYSLFTINVPTLQKGWAIPTATDIAFVIGILTFLGARVPNRLKIFLLVLSIIDDLGAILIIALYYNNTLNYLALIAAIIVIILMILIKKIDFRSFSLYLLLSLMLWIFILFSGIHATLAGIIISWLTPSSLPITNTSFPVSLLQYKLQPYVAYLILPLFAFTNAGVSLKEIPLEHLFSFLSLGIITGLVLGKPLGIILFTSIAVKLKLSQLPDNINFHHIFAAAVLCGIGFTMAIFIANLAFLQNNYITSTISLAKFGILAGSVTSGFLGYMLLHFTLPLQNELK